MKKYIFLFITILTFTCSNVSSQWSYQPTPNNASYYITIDFSGLMIGSAGGVFLTSDFFGRGAYTTNGGSSWQTSVVPDSTRAMIDIKYVNAVTGYCAGAYNSVLLSRPFNSFNPAKYNKRTLQLIEHSNTERGDNYKGLYLKTTNSGQSWFTYGTLPANVYYLQGLEFPNTNTGYAIVSYNISGGVNDGVVKTTNEGLSWSPLTMPENINSLSDIHFIDINTGFASGYDVVNDTNRGVILKTTNAGTTWSREIFMQLQEVSSISFTNSSTGLALSSSNQIVAPLFSYIYRTTNSGLNWQLAATMSDVDLMGVQFVAGTGTALAYGIRNLESFDYRDLITKTTNYGVSWSEGTFNDTGLILMGSKLIDLNNWYLCGGDFTVNNAPVILHTGNGAPISVSPVSTEIPREFSLQQNYPNPFNPSTNIGFRIAEHGFVSLRVFDAQGKEAAVLVNESLTPGVYNVHFDGSTLGSGIYFYRLSTGEFTQTRKMILLK